MWFEVESLFKVLVFWEEKLDFEQEVESLSDNQMEKSILLPSKTDQNQRIRLSCPNFLVLK